MSTILQPSNTDGAFEIVDIEENQENTELDAVLDELGVNSEDILLKVYRINDMGKEAQCFDCLPDAINGIEDRLRKAYGKGDYKIKVFAKTASGGKAVKKHINLSLETPLEPEKNTNEKTDDIQNVVSSMMQAMQESQREMMSMFRESQMVSQNKTQELLITVLGNKNESKEVPFIEQLAALKAIMPEQKDPLEGVIKMMNITEKLKESATPETPPAEGSMGQLLTLGSQLVEAAKSAPARTQPQPQPQSQQNTEKLPAPGAHPVTNQPPETPDMNFIVKQKLKGHLQMLCAKAAEHRSPALWADLTIEEIPEQFYPQLLDVLGDNDEFAFSNMLEINPSIADHKEWFESFIAEIRAAFVDPENEVNGDENDDDLTNVGDSGHDNENLSETSEKPVNANQHENTENTNENST